MKLTRSQKNKMLSLFKDYREQANLDTQWCTKQTVNSETWLVSYKNIDCPPKVWRVEAFKEGNNVRVRVLIEDSQFGEKIIAACNIKDKRLLNISKQWNEHLKPYV